MSLTVHRRRQTLIQVHFLRCINPRNELQPFQFRINGLQSSATTTKTGRVFVETIPFRRICFRWNKRWQHRWNHRSRRHSGCRRRRNQRDSRQFSSGSNLGWNRRVRDIPRNLRCGRSRGFLFRLNNSRGGIRGLSCFHSLRLRGVLDFLSRAKPHSGKIEHKHHSEKHTNHRQHHEDLVDHGVPFPPRRAAELKFADLPTSPSHLPRAYGPGETANENK